MAKRFHETLERADFRVRRKVSYADVAYADRHRVLVLGFMHHGMSEKNADYEARKMLHDGEWSFR